MTNATYNGWTNYATWRVHLEIFDNQYNAEIFDNQYNAEIFDCRKSAYDLMSELREYVESHIEETTEAGIGRDYALAFLSDVNWYEIAQNLIDNYADEVTA